MSADDTPIPRGQLMPIYHCHSPQRLLTESAKGKLAGEITRIHCEATGESPSFVNVLFLDIPEVTSFTAGRPSTRSFVFGEIRDGHPPAARVATGFVTDVDTPYRSVRGRTDCRPEGNP